MHSRVDGLRPSVRRIHRAVSVVSVGEYECKTRARTQGHPYTAIFRPALPSCRLSVVSQAKGRSALPEVKVRRRSPHLPRTGGWRGIHIARSIFGPHIEGMRAPGQVSIVLGRGTWSVGSTIQPALEGGSCLGRGEGERSGRATNSARGTGIDGCVWRCCIRWWSSTDSPGPGGGGGVDVARPIGGSHREGVRAFRETCVALRGAATAEVAAVEGALEGGARLGGGESEGGRGTADRP